MRSFNSVLSSSFWHNLKPDRRDETKFGAEGLGHVVPVAVPRRHVTQNVHRVEISIARCRTDLKEFIK